MKNACLVLLLSKKFVIRKYNGKRKKRYGVVYFVGIICS